MAGYAHQDDLCLLILVPANDAARVLCNRIEASSLCQIQTNSNHVQMGLIYTSNKQQIIKFQQDIQNDNVSTLNRKPSLNKFCVAKQNYQISKDFIKQRRVRINNRCLPSSCVAKDSSPLHAYNLWYGNKKKSIFMR